jgi:ribokinase
MAPKITVVGSINMDLIVRAPWIPKPGETIIGSDFQTAPGGKGANQSVAAARLGGSVTHVGRLGADAFGDQLLDSMGGAGVDCGTIIRDKDEPTGVALIVVDDQGENSIVVSSGANMKLTPGDVELVGDVIAGSDILVLQLEVPLETVVRSAQIAQENGVTVVLNPAPARELPDELLAAVDILIPNESEIELLSGVPASEDSQSKAAVDMLLELGVRQVILTRGARGALVADGNQVESVPAFQVRAVDTTAAGDAFVGGFSVALGEGRPVIDAVRWGNAAGALAATKLGAQPSLPGRAAVEEMVGEV